MYPKNSSSWRDDVSEQGGPGRIVDAATTTPLMCTIRLPHEDCIEQPVQARLFHTSFSARGRHMEDGFSFCCVNNYSLTDYHWKRMAWQGRAWDAGERGKPSDLSIHKSINRLQGVVLPLFGILTDIDTLTSDRALEHPRSTFESSR